MKLIHLQNPSTEEINLRGMNDNRRLSIALSVPTCTASPAQIRFVSESYIVYADSTTPYPVLLSLVIRRVMHVRLDSGTGYGVMARSLVILYSCITKTSFVFFLCFLVHGHSEPRDWSDWPLTA